MEKEKLHALLASNEADAISGFIRYLLREIAILKGYDPTPPATASPNPSTTPQPGAGSPGSPPPSDVSWVMSGLENTIIEEDLSNAIGGAVVDRDRVTKRLYDEVLARVAQQVKTDAFRPAPAPPNPSTTPPPRPEPSRAAKERAEEASALGRTKRKYTKKTKKA